MLAALADPAAPGVVVLADRHPIRWFQEALRLGVDDVLCLPQTPQSLGMAAAKARAARARRAPAATGDGPAGGGHVFTVFSTKGGSGRTVIASNLAVCFAQTGLRTLLVDLDLHSGDCRARPRARAAGDDARSGHGPAADRRRGARAAPSPATSAAPTCWPRPPGPRRRSWSRSTGWRRLLETARAGYDAVVIDASSAFSPTTLLALDHTDTLLLVGAPDVPAVRSVRIALETLDLLELDLPDVRIVMNRAGADVGLDTADIEATLRREIAYCAARPTGRCRCRQPRPRRACRTIRGRRVARSLWASAARWSPRVGQ